MLLLKKMDNDSNVFFFENENLKKIIKFEFSQFLEDKNSLSNE